MLENAWQSDAISEEGDYLSVVLDLACFTNQLKPLWCISKIPSGHTAQTCQVLFKNGVADH